MRGSAQWHADGGAGGPGGSDPCSPYSEEEDKQALEWALCKAANHSFCGTRLSIPLPERLHSSFSERLQESAPEALRVCEIAHEFVAVTPEMPPPQTNSVSKLLKRAIEEQLIQQNLMQELEVTECEYISLPEPYLSRQCMEIDLSVCRRNDSMPIIAIELISPDNAPNDISGLYSSLPDKVTVQSAPKLSGVQKSHLSEYQRLKSINAAVALSPVSPFLMVEQYSLSSPEQLWWQRWSADPERVVTVKGKVPGCGRGEFELTIPRKYYRRGESSWHMISKSKWKFHDDITKDNIWKNMEEYSKHQHIDYAKREITTMYHG